MMTDSPQPLWQHSSAAHHLDVADALEGEVDAAVGHLDDHLLDGLVVVVRVDAVGGAQLAGQLELALVDVDGDDAAGLGQRAPMTAERPMPPSPKMATLSPSSPWRCSSRRRCRW
jgi:hypothetical protein